MAPPTTIAPALSRVAQKPVPMSDIGFVLGIIVELVRIELAAWRPLTSPMMSTRAGAPPASSRPTVAFLAAAAFGGLPNKPQQEIAMAPTAPNGTTHSSPLGPRPLPASCAPVAESTSTDTYGMAKNASAATAPAIPEVK
jgi:hypothetical protein